MIIYANLNNLYNLLPYMKMALPTFDILLVLHKDERYGFHIDPKADVVDEFGRFKHFELLVENDFELVLNKDIEFYQKVNVAKFNKIFRMGMVALLGSIYKTKLDEFLFQKQKNQLVN